MTRYAYDVAGRRIAKRVYSAGPYAASVAYTRFLYRGGPVLAEADSAGTLTLAYTWGAGTDDLVAIHKYGTGAGDWYVMQDLLHSVRQMTRRDGTWVASWRYRIYGAVLDSAGSAPCEVRYRWTGREYDRELGFYFFRSRSYDPASQRFVASTQFSHSTSVVTPSPSPSQTPSESRGRTPPNRPRTLLAHRGSFAAAARQPPSCSCRVESTPPSADRRAQN